MKRVQLNFKEEVRKGLNEEELLRLKTAYDAIGDIGILEIDDELRSKEKFIAETLLKCQKNINTVLRKDSAHEGEFRTQKMVWLAGEKKKETIHIENKTRLKLDVEKVYFSPRMSNERIRICKQVKEGERILALFSGCAPYPCVISKNTGAKEITAVEMNPKGHKYAVENIKLNKLKNVYAFCGDARKVIDDLLNKKIGLKNSIDEKQMKKRLIHNPPIMELHLHENDLDDNFKEIEKTIVKLQKLNIRIIIHAPMKFRGTELNLSTANKKVYENSLISIKKVESLCKKYNLCGYVVHPYTEDLLLNSEENKVEILNRTIKKIKSKYLILENIHHGFFSNYDTIKNFIQNNNIKLCLDVVHLYLTREDDREFYETIGKLSELNTYFHIADTTFNRFSNKGPHAHEIGTGNINLERIVPYVKEGITEVVSKDENNPKEMINSYKKFNKMVKDYLNFDRILMPLPKNAEDFLDVVLKVSRKGTIIHFYDFLHESEFDIAREKIKKACKIANKKYEIIDFVKCGQFSPRTFRICADVLIKN
jgi:tRNA G37 N-methylase Trm5